MILHVKCFSSYHTNTEPAEDGHENESEHEGLPGNFTEKIIQCIYSTDIDKNSTEKVDHTVSESAVSSSV